MLEWLDGGGRADATYERRGVSGLTLLMFAARNGHERVVELLLRHGAKVNLQHSVGCTALMAAAQQGHERVVELLIRRGAEINKQDSNGGTALMFAAGQGHERVLELLLRHGTETNLQSSNGGTALLNATYSNHPAVCGACCGLAQTRRLPLTARRRFSGPRRRATPSASRSCRRRRRLQTAGQGGTALPRARQWQRWTHRCSTSESSSAASRPVPS